MTFGETVGAGLKYAGGVAKGALEDIPQNIVEPPKESTFAASNRNLMAALKGEETPYEQATKDVGGFPGLIKNISLGITETIPKLFVAGKVAGALEGAGASSTLAESLGAGATFGFTEKGFSPLQAGVMAVFPLAGKLGGRIMAATLSKLGITPENAIAQKALQSVGSLAASQAWMDASSTPEYLNPNISADEKKKKFIEGLGMNLAFHLAAVPGIVSEGYNENKIREASTQAAKDYQDEFWKGVGQKAASPVDPFSIFYPQPKEPNAPIDERQQPQDNQQQHPGTPQREDLQPNAPEVREAQGGQAGGGNRPEPVPAQPGAPQVLKPGDTAPVVFERTDPNVPSIGWYRVTEPFVSPESGQTIQPGPTTLLNSKQIEKFGLKIPDAEQAKFEATKPISAPPETAQLEPPQETKPAPAAPEPIQGAQPGEGTELTPPVAAPKTGGRPPVMRPPDLIDHILDNYGSIRQSSAAKEGSEGYYGEAYKQARRNNPHGGNKALSLFSDTGSSPDEIVDNLRRDGIVRDDYTVDDLWDDISRAHSVRATYFRGEQPEQKQEKFNLAVAKAAKSPQHYPISVGDLSVGSKFTIEKEPFEVTDIDPDTGEVTVKDGRKFGSQTVPDGADLPINKGSLKQPKATSQFVPPEPKPTPKLAPGVKQGDLLASTQKEDLSLAGERGTDAERVQREKAQAEANRVEREEDARRRQLELSKPSTELKKPAEILTQAKELKVSAPEGASLIRVTTSDGKSSTTPLSVLNKGENVFRGVANIAKIEAGTRSKDGKFLPMPGEVKVEERIPPTRLSVATEPATGITTESANNVIERLKLSLKSPVKFSVVNDPNWTHNGFPVEGSYSPLNDIVTLNLSHIRDEKHALQVLMGEVKAHLGLSKAFGGDFPKILDSLGKRITDDQLRQVVPQYLKSDTNPNGFDLADEDGRRRAVEEYVEKQAQTEAGRTFGRRLWIALKDFVQRVFGIKTTEAEIRSILSSAQQYLDGKIQAGPAGDQTMYSLARTSKEYEEQKAFEQLRPEERQLAPQRTLAAYGDLSLMKAKAADALNASDKARAAVNLPTQEWLAQMASTDLGQQRFTLDNYLRMRDSLSGSDPGARWSVIQDTLHALGNEQRRVLKTQAQFDAQKALVTSKGFVNKLRWAGDRELDASLAKSSAETYRNQISVEAGDVLRQLEEKGKTDAQYQTLRAAYERLQKMQGFSEAVNQRVRDIVDTVASTENGLNLLYQGGDKTGTQIYRAYIDLKESTALAGKAPPGTWLNEFDWQYLSPEERAKVEAHDLPVTSQDHKLFAQLASQVLAANTALRLQLTTLSHFRENPQFQAKVTKIGQQFKNAMAKDPNKAVDQIARTALALGKKQASAEAAFLLLNRQVMPEIQKYQTLKDAVKIDQAVTASDEWKNLVNTIHQDAGAIRIPDSEIKEVTAGTAWNEFTGKTNLRSPNGGQYEIDLGFTKASAAKAQSDMNLYLADVQSWLDAPENANSPDRQWWQSQYDWVDNVLNVSTVLSPTSTRALNPFYLTSFKHGAWTTPEFFFKSSSLPQAKLTFNADANFNRAWLLADQWYNGHVEEWVRALRKGAESHGYNPSENIHEYQRAVFDRIASAYRNGQAVGVGDRLSNGLIVTRADLTAFETQGRGTLELFTSQKNAGRERVMVDGLLIDEWAKNAFAIRAPQELGAKPGTTLPHVFSSKAKALSRLVSELPPHDFQKLTALLDSGDNFNDFVTRFLSERRAAYSARTPFEEIYRTIADKIQMEEPDAPKTVGEVLDYIEANTTGKFDRKEIEQVFLGEIEGQLRKFYNQFVKDEKPTDVRAYAAASDSAFTRGHQEDVGSSFYYEYGAMSSPAIRSLAMDSTNFHLARLARAWDALDAEYKRAIAEIESAPDRRAAIKEGMKAFRLGEDFRDWERLKNEHSQVRYFQDRVGRVFTGKAAPEFNVFGGMNRFTSAFVAAKLSGALTLARIVYGSIHKTAMNMAGVERFYWMAWPKAAVSTAMSAFAIPARALARTAGEVVKGKGLTQAFKDSWERGLSDVTEGLFRQGYFFNQQYQYGLGFKHQLGFRIANILTDPYSRGHLSQQQLPENVLGRWSKKAYYRMVSAIEAPLEIVRAYFPQLGYAIAYDATARAAGWTLDGIQAQARRTFDFLEKSGRLKDYNLNDPASLKNLLTADMVLPSGLMPKTQTNLNFARDWWQQSIDVPLNETIIRYWKQLADTSPEQRDAVPFLGEGRLDQARAGALMGTMIMAVHHASPENRPWELKTNRALQFLNPLAGWASQSTRQILQLMGRAPTDPVHSTAMLRSMAAVTLLSFLAAGVVVGEGETGVRKLLSKLLFREDYPVKQIWEASSGKEAAQIAGSDATSYIVMLNSIYNSILGNDSNRANNGIQVFTLQAFNDVIRYLNGVIKTGDITYGSAGLAKTMFPFSKPFVNALDSQQGLDELRSARILVQKYGPEELRTRGKQQDFVPNELSPIRQRLQNAIYAGDTAATQQAFNDLVAGAQKLGKSPEAAQKLAQQAVAASNPLSVNGQKMTPEQRAEFLTHLSGGEAATIQSAEAHYNAAEAALGTGRADVKQPRAGGAAIPAAPVLRPRAARFSVPVNRVRLAAARPRISASTTRVRGLRVPRLRRPVSRLRAPRVRRNRVRRVLV